MQHLKIQAYINHVQLAAVFFTLKVEYNTLLLAYLAIVELFEAVHSSLSTDYSH
jgi:hypothetical protein